MRKKCFVLAISALALAACMGDKVETIQNEGELITITASQEGTAGTRTTVVEGGTQVFWEPSDEIKLFFRGSGSRFLSQNTENSQVAEFSGTLNVVVGLNEGASGSNTLWGLYPYRADATSDGESVTTTLPAEQTGRAGSFAKNTHITLAKSNNFDLAFYNVCGGMRFSLTQEGIKRVTFEGNNGETLAGKIKLGFDGGVPVIQETTEPSTVLTLTAPNGGTFQTGQWYYFETLPGTLSQGYKMVFYKDSESAKLTSTSSVTFKRGIFGSLADADEDLMFKPTGGDEPNPDDVIQFADPIAKYACVEKFDTNGDGEVSYAEAAAVTTLVGLFTDWNTVTEFDEIRYFTSVTSTQYVFTGLKQLKHITIPDHITTLGTFQNCTALDTVNLPAALTALPAYCFDGCTSLKSVTLPTGITTIPNYAFRKCSSLSTLPVPTTLTSIGQYAFSGCTVLTGVELPMGLKTIGYYAFQNCQAISSVDYPASLTSVDSYAYSGCTALTAVTVGSGVSLGSNAFSGCTALTSAILSSGVSVGQSAFTGCSALSSVTLPEDMTSLPAGCFQNCSGLTSITWPSALTTIGSNAFDGCQFKENNYALELPASVTTIGSDAFGLLHHLVLPSTSAISIHSNSFKADYTYLYVPANMVEVYKVRTNWSNYADRIRPISDYPVAHPSVGGTIGEAIDLGLSVRWASWNIGASSPEGYGDFFAWGEVEPKWHYEWDNYAWCNGTGETLTKYNDSSSFGFVDNKVVLEPEDDAAHVHWGDKWRIPTSAEWTELKQNSTLVETTVNGVRGMTVTSNVNGQSIFVPFKDCWASTMYSAYSSQYGDYANCNSSGKPYINPYNGLLRFKGLPIRPVYAE